MGELGAGFNLSALQTNANCSTTGTYEGVALLLLGGTGSGEGWLLPDFHPSRSAS